MLKNRAAKPDEIPAAVNMLTRHASSDYVGRMNRSTAVSLLSALAQDTRLGVFRLLVEEGQAGLSVGDIAHKMKLSNTTLSFHLKELSAAGLLHARKDGRFVYYAPSLGTMNTLLDYLRSRT